MSARGVFVTGTDTGIGKTHVSVALLHALNAAGLRAVGMKPVASGCVATEQGSRNDDAESLIAASKPAPAYGDCNPFAFAPAIAPHVAAGLGGTAITLDPLRVAYSRLAATCDIVVVEGVGGWAVPWSADTERDGLMQADLVRALDLPVILVVGLRLGCINHALLTARAIAADGCRLLGWIANRIDPVMEVADASRAAIAARIAAPLLATLDFRIDDSLQEAGTALADVVATLRAE